MIHASTFLALLPAFLQGDSTAPPGGGTEEASGGWDFLFPIVLIVGIFYVVLILPERKKQKQRKSMLEAMKKGDKVMTSSGIYGSVAQVQDEIIVLQVADGVRLRFSRAAVQTVIRDDDGGEEPAK